MEAIVMATNQMIGLKTNEDGFELIQAAQQGDLEAFNQLVLAYQDRVFRWVSHLVNDPALAEDLTQTVFITVFQKLNTFRYGSFQSWLFRIARNLSYDELRRQQRYTSVSLDQKIGEDEDRELLDTLQDSKPIPEEVVEKHELAELIQRSLELLSADLREVILLVDLEELDYQAAADMIGVPIGTVKSRLARARMRFRQLLLENGLHSNN